MKVAFIRLSREFFDDCRQKTEAGIGIEPLCAGLESEWKTEEALNVSFLVLKNLSDIRRRFIIKIFMLKPRGVCQQMMNCDNGFVFRDVGESTS